jgi:thiol-disulfide isomerase/thioredoxin
MSEVQPAKKRPDLLRWALMVAALIGAAAVLYVIGAASFKPKQAADLSEFRRASLEKLVVPPSPGPAPDIAFVGPKGESLRIADFKGQVVVMNLWATWCPPCKTEMPTLAKLQALYATQPVQVVAITVDRDKDLDEARAELAANAPLAFYRDPGYRLAFGLEPQAKGFPTTVIYDRKGRERARLSGAANWASPEARGLIERLLAEG